jgi:polyhydroxyalkanoate synthesis regulator protein
MNTIVKYKNRKLYDRATKGYINLDALVAKIKNNETFTIIDNETKLDITTKTLKRALLLADVNSDDVRNMLRDS